MKGLLTQGSELLMSFRVLNLTLKLGLSGLDLGRDLGDWVTM